MSLRQILRMLLAACTVVAGCGTSPGAGSGGADDVVAGELLKASVDRADPDDADIAALVHGMTQFGTELHGQVAERDRNVVVSPTSIAMAFAMARAGARGETAEQIDTVLHFPPDATTTHASFNAVDRLLADIAPTDMGAPETEASEAVEDREPPALEITNGVFPQIGFPIRDEYLETLAAHYGAGVMPVDFAAEPDRTKQIIDDWVREQTRERIEELFAELPSNTRLVLANAIYLKADWEIPFSEGETRDLAFTRADGSEVDVPTMQRVDTMRYTERTDWQAVELPYTDGRLAMWVLVPSGDRSPSDLLNPDVLAAVGDTLAEGTVELRLPRWDFETGLDLREVMDAMGLHVPFRPAADFSGITGEPLWIDQAAHRANITVDEWGTEAAAVTGIAFAVSGPPPPEAKIHADRPFAFVVLDTESRTPLFVGQVADPAA